MHLPDASVRVPGFVFRGWSAEDIDDLVDAWRDPEMHRWMPEETDPFEASDAQAFVATASQRLTNGSALMLAIADEGTNRAVGSVTFHAWGPRHWNLGYWVALSARGRGLATASVSLLSRWAFDEYAALERLSLYTLPGNEASQRVATRAGFSSEGLLRRWGDAGDRQVDWVMYSLIRDDLSDAPHGEGPR